MTPDGVALAWGFNSTGVYAQQTSIVGNGVYEMAGNFLRGDQSAVSNSQRAVTLHAGSTALPYSHVSSLKHASPWSGVFAGQVLPGNDDELGGSGVDPEACGDE